MQRWIFVIVLVVVLALAYRVVQAPEKFKDSKSSPVVVETESGDDVSVEVVTPGDGAPSSFVESVTSDVSVGANIDVGVGPIVVIAPETNAIISSPFAVRGTARAVGDTVTVRIENTKGDTLIEESVRVTASPDGAAGTFAVVLRFAFKNTKEGNIVVAQADGSNTVRIPVRFAIE